MGLHALIVFTPFISPNLPSNSSSISHRLPAELADRPPASSTEPDPQDPLPLRQKKKTPIFGLRGKPKPVGYALARGLPGLMSTLVSSRSPTISDPIGFDSDSFEC